MEIQRVLEFGEELLEFGEELLKYFQTHFKTNLRIQLKPQESACRLKFNIYIENGPVDM